MRILQLTPGTGSFLCGSCLRDNSLALALRRLGNDVVVAPLYLPFMLEGEQPDADEPVHMGGINMYLQQKLPWMRHLPRFLANVLDSPGLLRWAASKSNMTDAHGLGAMTLSMLRGEHGKQAAELGKLIEWTETLEKPDVVLLSNVMLIGLARRIREALGAPIFTTLQGEPPFLDSLDEPYRAHCWDALAERAHDLDGFIAVSRYTGELMTQRLGLDADKVHVVPNGIEPDDFAPGAEPPPVPTVGYLARMCPDKGLHTLVDAFLLVRERGRVPGVRLRAAGVVLSEDKDYLRKQEAKVRAAGATGDVEFLANVERDEKIRHLQGLTVMSVPATYGESFGLYVLEALACGVPVVQPRHAAFPELIEATGGGLLCEPDDARSLADGLEELLLDPERARALGATGRRAVLENFTAERMARDVERVCSMGAPAEATP
jgi:glycosyltransferase involved in cell wall biosynthesis